MIFMKLLYYPHNSHGMAAISKINQLKTKKQYTCVSFLFACSVFLLYLDDVMRALEKIRGLVILDCYFSGRMETISM